MFSVPAAVRRTVGAPLLYTIRSVAMDELIMSGLNSSANDCMVDWGDGAPPEHVTTSNPTHVYAVPGDYQISVTGLCSSFTTRQAGQNTWVISVDQLGETKLNSLIGIGYDAPNLVLINTGIADTSAVGGMSSFCFNCPLAVVEGMDTWDVSAVTIPGGVILLSPNALTTAKYDAVLTAWGAQTVNAGIEVTFDGVTYSAAGQAGRDSLIAQGWTIADAGLAP